MGGSTTAAPARGLRWVLALIAAVLAFVSGQLGAIPASAAPAAYTCDAAASTYNASANLSIANATAAAVRSPPLAQEARSWVRPVSTGRSGVAANTVAEAPALSISPKIGGQMGPRGWSQELMEGTVANPAARHPVWDFTSGTKQAATAYARSDGSYVVVNDSTGTVVQVSDINNAGWKPVWDDPRFQR